MKALQSILGVGALICACAGCTRGPELGEVSGVVTLEGKPVAGVIIVFQPDAGRPSMAETNAEGRFKLGYTARRSGAMIGQMRVSLRPILAGSELDLEKAAAKKFPPKYLKPFETVEIASGKNEFNFDLTRGK